MSDPADRLRAVGLDRTDHLLVVRPWLLTADGADNAGRGELVVPWDDVLRLAPAHPWPSLSMVFRDSAAGRQRSVAVRIHPYGAGAPLPRSPRTQAACERFSEAVQALVEEGLVPARIQRRVERGWLDLPDVPWEATDVLPGETDGRGAYRSDGRSQEVLGRRVLRYRPYGSLRLLLMALVSGASATTLRQVQVSPDHVYVEMWDRSRWRLPLSTLSARLPAGKRRSVFVFGRRTFLVLRERRRCAATAALVRRLP